MVTIGALGYAAVGALYALLSVLLLTTWRGHRIGVYLILACVISAVWGFGLAAQTAYGSIHPVPIAMLEALRATAWIAFLVRLNTRIGGSRILNVSSVAASVLLVLAIVVVATQSAQSPGRVINLGGVMIPGGLLLALFGLVLIEQLYRNSSAEARWSLKPLVLGVGGIFAYDLFLYSQSVLLDTIDVTTWIARGVVNLAFVPMVAIAARRNTDWEMRIFVSRQVVFYSTTLIAVGLYLLLMSFGGYLIVLYGGSWGGLARIIFFAGAAIVLITLLFSTTLRARLKVFLAKNFFHNKYDHREEWLRLVATLAEFDNSTARDVAIKAIAQIVNSPEGAMWVRDNPGSEFRLTARFRTEDEFPDIGRDEPLVRFIEKEGWLIDLEEYAQNAQHYDDVELPDWLRDRDSAWLMVPLQASGELLGLILLARAPGPPRLNYEDRDLLKTVGNHIAVHLAQARSDNMLAEAKQFEAYNRLTAFLMHDLSNLVAQQSLIVANAEKHKRNPEFIDDAIKTIAGSVERMKRVIGQLKTGDTHSPPKLTALKFIISAAVDRCAAKKPVPRLQLNGVDANIAVNAEEFTMVLAHLVRNAQDACSKDGSVEVSLHQSDGATEVVVADDGAGMSTEFVRDRLFRPFDSTKGSQGMGIGAHQAREFARKMGWDLDVQSRPGEGTRISMKIPTPTPGQ